MLGVVGQQRGVRLHGDLLSVKGGSTIKKKDIAQKEDI